MRRPLLSAGPPSSRPATQFDSVRPGSVRGGTAAGPSMLFTSLAQAASPQAASPQAASPQAASLDGVVPGLEAVEAVEDGHAAGALVGVAVEAQGQGYADTIRVLWGYSPERAALVGRGGLT